MAGEWSEVRLRDISEVITKGTTPTTVGMGFATHGINFIKAESVMPDGCIDSSKFAFIDERTHAALRRSQIRAHDLLFSMAGVYIGKTAVVPPELIPANTNQALAIIRLNQKAADPRFVGYYLRNPAYNVYVNNLVAQSAQPNLNLAEIGNLPIALPPLPEQQAIAHILGTLDDKIELNRRMNQTLEAMARAIFKSWFVDFLPVRAKQRARTQTGDPVRAKAQRKDAEAQRRKEKQGQDSFASLRLCGSALNPDIADLFPDEFEESELGEIPRGWKIHGLDEIGTFLNGLALQKYPPKDDRSLPVIKIAQLRKDSTVGADLASADIDPAYIVDDGDVLFSWSGSLECVLWTGGPGALNQHLFKVTSDTFPKWFCYFWIHHHLSWFRNIAAGKATTMGHIQRGHLSDAKTLVPTPQPLEAMSQHFTPLLDDLIAKRLESRTLASLRDTLLPKLISGEMRVKDAERIVGRCV